MKHILNATYAQMAFKPFDSQSKILGDRHFLPSDSMDTTVKCEYCKTTLLLNPNQQLNLHKSLEHS